MITSGDITVPAEAHTATLSYSIENPVSGESIKAESDQDWLHSFNYDTEGEISFEVDANTSDGRDARVTLSYPTAEPVTVTVTQMSAGESISLEPETLSFLPEGGDLSVKVVSGRAWVLTGESDWVTASSDTGEPGAEVVFTAAANESDEPRDAEFLFICGTNRVTLTVNQSYAGRLIVEEPEYRISGAANTFSIGLQSNMKDVKVEITEGGDWLSEVSTKAMENMSFEFSATENGGEDDRRAVVVFSNADASEQVSVIQEPVFPKDVLSRVEDDNFKAYLLENFDSDSDGKISKSEAQAVTEIVYETGDLVSAAGIEYFENLVTVNISANTELKTLNLSNKKALKSVTAYGNTALEELNLQGSASVEYLNTALCASLTEIDVTEMTSLREMVVYSTGITELDVSNNKELEYLAAYGTQILETDLSVNTKIKTLALGDIIRSVDITPCTELVSLTLHSMDLKELDLSANTKLETVNMSGVGIVELDFSNCPELSYLTVDGSSSLTTLDLSKNMKLNYLSCYECAALEYIYMTEGQYIETVFGITQDDVTWLPFEYPEDLAAGIVDENLKSYILGNCDVDGDNQISYEEASAYAKYIDCSGRGIKSFEGMEYFKEIVSLIAADNEIQEIDLSSFQMLEEIDLSGNRLTEIDFSRNPDIRTIDLSDNVLESVTSLPTSQLETLDLSGNLLTDVDAGYASYLTWLDLSDNALTTCNVYGDEALTYLDCSNNQLDQINVWTLEALRNLNVSNNPMVVIGTYYTNQLGTFYQPQLTYLVALETLDCSNTDVLELDLSACTALTQLIATGCGSLTDIWLGDMSAAGIDMKVDSGVNINAGAPSAE